MDLFLTEEDYLPAEFDELPLDEAILRVRELEDERPSSSKQKKSQEKRKRNRDDDDEDKSDGPDDQYSDDDGWLVNDLGDDGYIDEDEEDDDNVATVKDGVKVFGADEAEEEDDGSKKKKKKKAENDNEEEKKPRRRNKTGPRVMLNADRLRDIRGIAALPDIQRNLRFRGKGHEEEDLAMIMEVMEQWAHRLMPKMRFDDFIKRTELLGRKKIIKVFVHNLRYGMPLNTVKNGQLDIDFDKLDRESDEDFAFDDDLPPMPTMNAEDAFDAMMREAEEVVKQRAAAAAVASNTNSPSTSGLQSTSTNQSLDKTVTPMKTSTQTMSSQNITPVTPKTPSTLTEEQRKRIAENARKAAEKRLALSIARSQQTPNS